MEPEWQVRLRDDGRHAAGNLRYRFGQTRVAVQGQRQDCGKSAALPALTASPFNVRVVEQRGLAHHPTRSLVATCAYDRHVKLWEVPAPPS